jgi:hypothetical protein
MLLFWQPHGLDFAPHHTGGPATTAGAMCHTYTVTYLYRASESKIFSMGQMTNRRCVSVDGKALFS